ncbi:MAG TPA: PIN domain-containing protein [Candidatus Limnocylindria bacterium]|jgi:predicted nucleic acid-binding protein|nr:PIN domain-containing protein [Candidatus Limnocylindria bacterium]
MTFIDTNILLYAICPSATERLKAEKAREILRRDDLALSVQVLQEFYVQATRPTRAQPLSHAEATALIELWLRFTVIEVSVSVMQAALHLKDRFRTSYWDAAILAAANCAVCHEVLSEDLNPGQTYNGVRVVNPFS